MGNKAKITRHKTAKELSKRVKLPYTVTDYCPHCGQPCVRDLSVDGIDYPTPGEPINLFGYCGECDIDFEMIVVFDVAIRK